MRTLYFASEAGLPRAVDYHLTLTGTGLAEIIVIEPFRLDLAAQPSHNQRLRDTILDRILQLDLVGVDIRHVRLYVLTESQTPGWLRGIEFPISSSGEGRISRGPDTSVVKTGDFEKTGRWRAFVRGLLQSPGNAPVTGSVFSTDPINERPLTPENIDRLSHLIDYRHMRRRSRPTWPPEGT